MWWSRCCPAQLLQCDLILGKWFVKYQLWFLVLQYPTKSSLVCIYFFVILCVCAHTYHTAQCVCRSEDYLQEYILSFYREGSEWGFWGWQAWCCTFLLGVAVLLVPLHTYLYCWHFKSHFKVFKNKMSGYSKCILCVWVNNLWDIKYIICTQGQLFITLAVRSH